MSGNYYYKDVLPFSAMVAVECTNVVSNVLFKAAASKGLSNYVFNAYSFAMSVIIVLPLAFIISRTTGLPPLTPSLLYKFFLLGVLGSVGQICGYKGIEYSSPSLASAVSNLTPAFTFTLAVIFRMEKLALRSSSTQAKIIGTIVSISGALIVVLYEGPTIISTSSQPPSPPHYFHLGSSERSRIIGGLLFTLEYLLFSMWYIVQTQVIKIYPSEIIVIFLYYLSGTIISVPLCLIAETNLNAWRLHPDIALLTIVYAGFASSFSTGVHTWGLHLKGPVYVSSFRPLSIAIATALGVIFLGDALYLGSVVGTIFISIGFYACIWGIEKGKEEMSEDCDFGSLETSSNYNTPSLQRYTVEGK